jgi:hypothetical protein
MNDQTPTFRAPTPLADAIDRDELTRLVSTAFPGDPADPVEAAERDFLAGRRLAPSHGTIYILARDIRAARDYAQAHRLGQQWKFVRSPDDLRGVRWSRLALAPGWESNRRIAELGPIVDHIFEAQSRTPNS